MNFGKDPRLKVLNDGALLISDIEESDAGSYKCVVNSGVGQYVNGPAQITVGESPEIVLDPPSGFNLDRGSSLEVFCLGNGRPEPKVWWQRKNEERVLIGSKDRHALLKIDNADKSDNGKYICYANNTVGQATIEIEIVVSGKLHFQIQND